MYNDSITQNTPTTSKSGKPNLFIPFLLVLLCAIGVGFGIRYYKGSREVPTEAPWSVYFSEVGAGETHNSLEKRLVVRLSTATAKIDAALQQLNSTPIADAFIKAHQRGIQVRIVTETDYMDEVEIARFAGS